MSFLKVFNKGLSGNRKNQRQKFFVVVVKLHSFNAYIAPPLQDLVRLYSCARYMKAPDFRLTTKYHTRIMSVTTI